MPLVFDQPETVEIKAAKVTAIVISLDGGFAVSVNYIAGPESDDGSVQAVRVGTETFSHDEYAACDATGAARDAVKACAYALLEKRLGSGQIA